MNINWKYAMGVGTIVGVVAFTAYAIKKSKDQKKLDEESMSVEEAMAEVRAYKVDQDSEPDMTFGLYDDEEEEEHQEKLDDFKQDVHDEVAWNMSFEPPKDDIERPDFTYDGIDFDRPFIETMTEEDKILRHEPNSDEARKQFIKMELAEWTPREEAYSIMLTLFNHPFNPENDGDWELKNRIIDYRVQFFGFNSKWAKDVTYADVILHYARLANFNLDGTVGFWVQQILEYNAFTTEMHEQEIFDILEALNNHIYFNEATETFGLFGLTAEEMNEAMRIASRNIDNSVTYEIEFNEFLKGQL